MKEDQTINKQEVQKKQENLYLLKENTTYSQSQGLGIDSIAQSAPSATQSLSVCPVCGSTLPEGADYCEN